MKRTQRLLAAAFLLLVMGVNTAPAIAKATERTKDGTADIEFTKDTTPDTGVPDPTSDRPDNTDSSVVDPNVGDFGIYAVTPLDFKSHIVTMEGGVYKADAYTANPDGTDSYTVENYVAIKDLRATKNHTYTLMAKLTKQFTAVVDGLEKPLNGATLTYKNINVAATRNPLLIPENKSFGHAGSGTSTLAYGSDSIEVYKNNDPAKGKGYYEITFGDDAKGTEADSVELAVPSAIRVHEAIYNATVLWTLSDTK